MSMEPATALLDCPLNSNASSSKTWPRILY